MHARSSTFRGERDGLDDAVAYVRDEVMPGLGRIEGWVGLSMMVDRSTGECIATTAWDSIDAMRASGDRLTAVRGRVGGLLHAPATVEEWDVEVMHRSPAAGAATWCRVSWLRTEPARLGRGIDVYRDRLLPRIEALPGFCSASLMVNRARGRVCATASFSGLEALQVSRDEAWSIRETGIREADVDIMDAAEYELAIASLRVPVTV